MTQLCTIDLSVHPPSAGVALFDSYHCCVGTVVRGACRGRTTTRSRSKFEQFEVAVVNLSHLRMNESAWGLTMCSTVVLEPYCRAYSSLAVVLIVY